MEETRTQKWYRKKLERLGKEEINRINREQYYLHKDRVRATQRIYEKRIQDEARTDKILHAKILIKNCRNRVRKQSVPFEITYKDIPIPEKCPILGMELKFNRGKVGRDSATIDKIIPSLGYVKGNVIVISMKANLIKNDAIPDEIIAVGAFYKELINGIKEMDKEP